MFIFETNKQKTQIVHCLFLTPASINTKGYNLRAFDLLHFFSLFPNICPVHLNAINVIL